MRRLSHRSALNAARVDVLILIGSCPNIWARSLDIASNPKAIQFEKASGRLAWADRAISSGEVWKLRANPGDFR